MGVKQVLERIVSVITLLLHLSLLRFSNFFKQVSRDALVQLNNLHVTSEQSPDQCIRLNHQQIIYRTAPGKHSDTSGTILLIGDCTAEGIGDSISNGGLPSRLNKLIRENKDQNGLRFIWHVVTRGRLHSTSADWLPVPAGAPSPGNQKPSLFEQAVVSGLFKNAQVVVVMLGMHDDIEQVGTETVANILSVTEAIVRLGKHAVVCALPNCHPPKSDEYTTIRSANQTLRASMTQLSERTKSPGCGTIAFDVDPGKAISLGNDVLSIEEDFITLNSRGYRVFASELYDSVAKAAKKVEWTYWSGRLAGM